MGHMSALGQGAASRNSPLHPGNGYTKNISHIQWNESPATMSPSPRFNSYPGGFTEAFVIPFVFFPLWKYSTANPEHHVIVLWHPSICRWPTFEDLRPHPSPLDISSVFWHPRGSLADHREIPVISLWAWLGCVWGGCLWPCVSVCLKLGASHIFLEAKKYYTGGVETDMEWPCKVWNTIWPFIEKVFWALICLKSCPNWLAMVSLSLGFLICKMGIIRVSTSWDCCRNSVRKIYVKNLEQYLAYNKRSTNTNLSDLMMAEQRFLPTLGFCMIVV